MKISTLFFMFLIGPTFTVQAQTQRPVARDTFNPALHAIGVKVDGHIELLASEYVLGKSLRSGLPDVGTIEKIEKQQVQGTDYLLFDATAVSNPSQRYYIGIPLYTDANGFVFAAAAAIFCNGATSCAKCQAVEGCPCTGGGSCSGGSIPQMALGTVLTGME